MDDLVQQLQQAVRDKNASLQWKLAYQIAGGKHGPKKRRYDHPQRFRATAQEWVHELSLAGPQGGCAATRLDKASADAIFRLYSQGANCFQKTQCRRTLFQRRTFCSMMGLVVGHGGHNRLVLACTCTFGSLQRRTWGSCAKPCEHYDAKELFLTGEQAITQQRCINWRLQHAGLGHVTVLYDVKNAFPSPSHDSLDAAVRQHARPDDVELLMQRHREAYILLRDPFRPTYTVLQVGCGNMQGDRMAPSQFLSVYLPAVEEWHVACQALPHGAALLATDPVSGHGCDTSLSTFADDVAKTHAIPTAPEFAPIVTRMDTGLDCSLQGLGMAEP